MINNKNFLNVIKKSFKTFLATGARSNEKLKILHGDIAKSVKEKLGSDYEVKSLGFEDGKEFIMDGRYNPKAVDITIMKDNIDLAGIAVKFVMNNYSQNSNNYFENMLGETANIRSNNKKYFQVFVIPDEMPYYKKGGGISKWEKLTENNIKKYIKISNDDIEKYYHTPDKILIFVIKLPNFDKTKITNKEEYNDFYLKNEEDFLISEKNFGNFGDAVIYNNYEYFIDKIYHHIKSI